MPDDHHITIDGKRWLLRFTRLKGGAAGWTFFDNAKRPRMLIDDRLRGRCRFETIVHELLHAAIGPAISEESVTEAAKVIARTCWNLGYREVPNGEEQ